MALNEMNPSELLAGSCYGRGLWSPVLIWRAISDKPYRGSAVQWGLDRNFIRRHLKRAAIIGTAFAVLNVLLIAIYYESPNPWVGLGLLLALFLQWALVPWAVLRLGWVKHSGAAEIAPPTGSLTRLFCKDATSALPDLGFLLREATFSVDSTSRKDAEGRPPEATGNPAPEEFYAAISKAAAKIPSFRVVPLHIVTSPEAQPGSEKWGPWYRARCQTTAEGEQKISRLLIIGEQSGIDGFASAEFMVQEVAPHFSFLLRLRWMPPLRKRLHRLGFLSEQRTWWRAGLLPAMFVAVLLLANWTFDRAGELMVGLDPGVLQLAMFGILAAQWVLYGVVLLAAVGPIAVLLLIFLYRAGRYLWGVAHSLAGAYLEVNAPRSFRYLSTRTIFESGDEFQWGVACSQITQEVITNCVIAVLRKYGIDTNSIREEVRNFINEGVYMTGGTIAAENLAVGNLARILRLRGKMRSSRSGRRSLVGRVQKVA